jgi:hypothetical protein
LRRVEQGEEGESSLFWDAAERRSAEYGLRLLAVTTDAEESLLQLVKFAGESGW